MNHSPPRRSKSQTSQWSGRLVLYQRPRPMTVFWDEIVTNDGPNAHAKRSVVWAVGITVKLVRTLPRCPCCLRQRRELVNEKMTQ